MKSINQVNRVKSKQSVATSNLSAIDIVTGETIKIVYFDPNKIVDNPTPLTDEWLDYNIYQPANVVKDENGMLTIRLPDGKFFKAIGCNYVSEQDNEGVDDILKLREFSAMSLIHTLRVRYSRDEIYTFVGTILISINPYKWFKDLYSDRIMTEYHSTNQVS